MTENFINGVHSSNNPMLDVMMEDPPYIFPFGETDSQQGQRFDTRNFDFTELFPAAGEAQNFLGTEKVDIIGVFIEKFFFFFFFWIATDMSSNACGQPLKKLIEIKSNC